MAGAPGTIERVMGSRPRRSAPPPPRVAAMFDDIVGRYDLLNRLLSLGLDRRWRRATVRAARSSPNRPVLDLGCGTGDLASLATRSGHRVVGVDLSRAMLSEARRKSPGLPVVQGSALALPFADQSFGGAVSGFVLRNLNDLPRAFAELARVLEPGGPIALMDITGPRSPLLRRGFDLYFGA